MPTRLRPRADGQTRTTATPLYWAAYGPEQAERALVLHGGPGAHHDYLLPQFLRLATQHELLFYDQRGGGRSRGDGQQPPVTWQSHVDDLARVAREFHLEPLTLIAFSWGGLLALLYALEAQRHPTYVKPARLVLIDPAPLSRPFRHAFEDEFNRRQRSEALREMREELADSGLRERDPEAYRKRAFELSVAGYFARPEAARALTPFRVTARVQDSVWESLGDYDLVAQLGTLHVPTFFIHGRADPIPLDSTELAARAMRARLLVLEASGHVPYVEQPDALFSAIEQFLQETAPGRT
ncbi:MAG TPA: alpha/beta fold hydrolase [Gemmatimonadaceae bacterium]|nr:alpha/beta fold hydrolase [Gemmatimonadaceae bacterium]